MKVRIRDMAEVVIEREHARGLEISDRTTD